MFFNVSYADSPNPSAASSFDSFSKQNGNNWTSQWNNQTGYSQGVITWGKGYQGRGNLPASTPHLFYPTIANQGVCVKPTSPTLSPAFIESQKLSILGLQASPAVISEGNGYTNTTVFDMSFAAMHTDALQGQVDSQSEAESKVFYIIEQIVIMDSSNNTVATLYNTTYVNPGDCINQGNGNKKDSSSNECEWMGAQASVPFTPEGYSDGVYSYQLTAALYRESINNGQDSTKPIATAQTGVGTIIIDSTPPTITITEPSANSVLDNSYPQIIADYHDNLSCIDTSTFKASLDYTDVTALFITTDSSASFQPSYALSDGVHGIDVSIKDMAGNTSDAQENFSIFTGQNAYQSVIGFFQALAPVFGYPADLHDLKFTNFYANFFSGTINVFSIYEFDQYVNGVPVLGGQLKAAVNINYQPIGLLGNYYPGVTNINITPGISATTAENIAIADQHITDTTLLDKTVSTLAILPVAMSGMLVWEVTLQSLNSKLLLNYTYLIDAQTGNIVRRINNILTYNTYTGSGKVFIAPPTSPYNLDTAFSQESIENLLTNSGCLNGIYANVTDFEFGGACIPSGCNSGTTYYDMPDENQVFCYSSDESCDALTDIISAYYDVDLVDSRLKEVTGFVMNNNNNNLSVPTQVDVMVDTAPPISTPLVGGCLTTSWAENAASFSASNLIVGAGAEWLTTTSNSSTVYLFNDYTRNPDVIYHEYGHSLLDSIGITPELPMYGAYQEGFADTNAFFMTGDPELAKWLYSPYLRDANNTTFQPQWFSFPAVMADPHLEGEVYSGAMWDLRNRIVNTYHLSSDIAWWLDVDSAYVIAEDWRVNTSPQDFSFVITPLESADKLQHDGFVYACATGFTQACSIPYFWHEIEGAFARHGVLQLSSAAIAIPEIGEHKTVDPTNSPVNFTIYSGNNPDAKLFFYNPDGSYCGSSGDISMESSPYTTSTVFPGCSLFKSGYHQGCAVYNAASVLSNCQNGDVQFVTETYAACPNMLAYLLGACGLNLECWLVCWVPGNTFNNAYSGGPTQYIDKESTTGGGGGRVCRPGCNCSTVPLPLSVTATNLLLLCLPGLFILFIKSRINKWR